MEENKVEEVQTNEQPVTEQPTEVVVTEPVQSEEVATAVLPTPIVEQPVVEQPVVEQPVVDPVPVQLIKRSKKDIIGYNPETGEPIYKEYVPGEIPPKKSKKGLIITIIILVLLIAGGLTTWLLLSNNGDSDTDEPDTEEKDNKKDNKKKKDDVPAKTIHFYKDHGKYVYTVTYGSEELMYHQDDIINTYECDTESCFAKGLDENTGKVVIQVGLDPDTKFYVYDIETNKTTEFKLDKDYADFKAINDDFVLYTQGKKDEYALFNIKINKTITDFNISTLTVGNVISYDNNEYTALSINDTYVTDFVDNETGKLLEDREKKIIKFIYDYAALNGKPAYHINTYIDYLKEKGLTDEFYIISLGLGFNGAALYANPDLKPTEENCSVKASNGEDISCDKLYFYDFDALNENIYKYYGKKIEKKDFNGKFNAKYFESINALGLIEKMIGGPGENWPAAYGAISYTTSGSSVDIKYAYFDKDGESDFSDCVSETPFGGTNFAACSAKVAKLYKEGKADHVYTLHLVWDKDHYYIDDIKFEK